MLPLSWTHTDQQSSLDTIPLMKAQFAYFGSFETSIRPQDLFQQIYDGTGGVFLLRGCRADLARTFAQFGCQAIPLGIVADIQVNGFSPSPSLKELGCRGQRKAKFEEVECSLAESLRKIVLSQSRYSDKARLKYLFRQEVSADMRSFILKSTPDDTPLVFLSISPTCSDWHIEELIRSTNAPVGAVESLMLHVIEVLTSEEVTRLSLGEVPFYQKSKAPLYKPTLQSIFIQIVSTLIGRGLQGAYGSSLLFDFKDKFSPVWEPVYWVGYPKIYLRDFILLSKRVQYMKLAYNSSCQSVRRFIPALPTL